MDEEKELRFTIKDGKKGGLKNFLNQKDLEKSIFYISDTYFDTEDYHLTKSKQAYRRRLKIEEKATCIYEYKKMEDDKIYEKELAKDEFLKSVDSYSPQIVIMKKRTIWSDNKKEFVLDETLQVGDFFEIECQTGNPKEVEMPFDWLTPTRKGITDFWLENNN